MGPWLLCILMLSASGQGATVEEKSRKPFGLGHGPAFVGGRETDGNGTLTALNIYNQYIQYRRLLGKADEEYYKKFTDADRCIGTCGKGSYCSDGICVCDHNAGWTQIYGRCFDAATAVFHDTNHNKFRKPVKPEWCFCKREVKEGKEKRTEKFVCEEHYHKEECQDAPDLFDHNAQFCKPSDHSACHAKVAKDSKSLITNLSIQDINMYCSDKTAQDPKDYLVKNLCACRPDTRWDADLMECRLYIDADCTYVDAVDLDTAPQDIKDIVSLLKQTGPLNTPVVQGQQYSQQQTDQAFCNLIESEVAEYVEHIIGEFTILGLSLVGFILASCATCITCCCCCECCKSIREKIRSYDPRYILQQANARMDGQQGQGGQGGRNIPTTELAALGALAANEYMSNKQEQGNAAQFAAMQGGAPQGVPYPPGQSPYPGYAPVPTQAPGQGGGMMEGVMGMAPELALAGAGAWSGNNAMMALGGVGLMEKAEMSEDNDDRLRAAAVRGVPPAPPGYPGGQQLPSYQPQLPPAAANYPRQ